MSQEFSDPRREKDGWLALQGHLIKVTIGSEGKIFYVQDCILSKTSKFMQMALKKEWAEGKERELALPEEDPDAMMTAHTMDIPYAILTSYSTTADQLIDPCANGESGIKLEGTPVKLVVGPTEDCTFVHPSLLNGSGFFTTALKQEWAEGQSNSITLADEDVNTAETYVQWLYTGFIIVEPSIGFEATAAKHIHLAELYIFGEKIMDNRFQNSTIDAIVATCRKPEEFDDTTAWCYPGAETVKLIYENTPQSSPARRLMVHVYHDYGSPSWIPDPDSKMMLSLPYEFLSDLTAALLDRAQSPIGNDLKGKQIHVGLPSDYYKQDPEKAISGEAAEES